MSDKPVEIQGTIENVQCTYSQPAMQYVVTVSAEIVPAEGEAVALAEGGTPPHALVFHNMMSMGAPILLQRGGGNSWSGSGVFMLAPETAKVYCRFVSNVVSQGCDCEETE